MTSQVQKPSTQETVVETIPLASSAQETIVISGLSEEMQSRVSLASDPESSDSNREQPDQINLASSQDSNIEKQRERINLLDALEKGYVQGEVGRTPLKSILEDLSKAEEAFLEFPSDDATSAYQEILRKIRHCDEVVIYINNLPEEHVLIINIPAYIPALTIELESDATIDLSQCKIIDSLRLFGENINLNNLTFCDNTQSITVPQHYKGTLSLPSKLRSIGSRYRDGDLRILRREYFTEENGKPIKTKEETVVHFRKRIPRNLSITESRYTDGNHEILKREFFTEENGKPIKVREIITRYFQK